MTTTTANPYIRTAAPPRSERAAIADDIAPSVGVGVALGGGVRRCV